MRTERWDAAVLKLNDDKTLILGGSNGNDEHLSSSEILSSNGFEDAEINFPVTIVGHCMMKFSESEALVTGGVQNRLRSAATWILNTESKMVAPGPRMKIGRQSHGCATLHLGDKTFGLVAGGFDGNDWDSTEFVDFGQENPSWTDGPRLPSGLYGPTLVETTEGVLAIGGYDDEGNSRKEIYKLMCPNDQ